MFDLPVIIERKKASQMEQKLQALKATEQAKLFEQQLEARED